MIYPLLLILTPSDHQILKFTLSEEYIALVWITSIAV